MSKMEGENGALLHRRVVKVHGHWLKGGRVLFLVCKGGGNGVCKSRLLQCQKCCGSVHSWAVKDGVATYQEEHAESDPQRSPQTFGEQPRKIMACDWMHKLNHKRYKD